jgi:hypothetical protein
MKNGGLLVIVPYLLNLKELFVRKESLYLDIRVKT